MSASIPPISSQPVRLSEAAEGPGADRVGDRDGDDAAAAALPTAKAPTAPGTGAVVDKFA